MTGAAIAPDLFDSPQLQKWQRVRQVVREAAALGAQFRLAGKAVAIDEPPDLPLTLRDELLEHGQSGRLRKFLLSGEDPDLKALALANQLGVGRKLVTDRLGARAAVRELITDMKSHGGHLGVDIETAPRPEEGKQQPLLLLNSDGAPSDRKQARPRDRTGLDPHRAIIGSLQLYAGGRFAYIFRGAALTLVRDSHWFRRQHLVAHNAGFETSFLQHHSRYRRHADRRPRGRLDCTMQAFGLLHGVGFQGEKRSLESAAKILFDLDVPKDLQTSDWGAEILSAGQLAYAASDAILVWRMWPGLERELQDRRRWAAYQLQRGATNAVADMELRGLTLDRGRHAEICRVWSEALADARRAYSEATGEPPPTTTPEVQRWLEGLLERHPELRPWPLTPNGKLSTKASHLKRLVDHESARHILTIRAREQLLQNFGPKLIECVSPVTGCIHGRYSIAGTKAGRFSAQSPNLQQLPSARAPEFKKCVVPRRGYVIVGCDWNQIEMRAIACISKDRQLTRLYAEGRDIHTETASSILRIAADRLTPLQRQYAKPVNYGAIYGLGPAGLRENAFADYGIEMTLREAENALDRFFVTFKGVRDWRRKNADICKARRYVLIGVGRIVHDDWEPFGLSFPQCCNLPIQGACADACLRALTWIHARLKRAKFDGGVLACIHDELLLEIRAEQAEDARQLLEATMIEAFIATFPGAPTRGVATAAIGESWAEAKP